MSGIFAILFIVVQAIIYPQMVSYNPRNLGDLLTFALTRTNLYYVEYYSAGLWMLFALPGVIALYFVLSHRDKGLALIGSALGLLGIGVFLSNLADHILFVQEAVTYSGGCTSCSAQALSGAAATFSVGIADTFAGFMLGAGIIFFSSLMFAGHHFAKPIAGLGVGAGVMMAGIYPLITLTMGSDVTFYAGVLSAALIATWYFIVGAKLYRIA
ncbi:MAG TPA: hypothetical protein VNA15_09375 [Candidatus Angelobacter sp.]|nr:hypothetical protein [Candidatus Angelobacter sp.]